MEQSYDFLLKQARVFPKVGKKLVDALSYSEPHNLYDYLIY